MPWSRSRPGGNTVNPKYRSKAHRDKVAEYAAQMERDGYLICAESRCVMASRVILPGMARAAGHDPSGTYYIGPVHRACNASDAGRRARERQTVTARRM